MQTVYAHTSLSLTADAVERTLNSFTIFYACLCACLIYKALVVVDLPVMTTASMHCHCPVLCHKSRCLRTEGRPKR